MAYARATTVDASHGGDSVKQAVLDCDTDLTGIFANLNTHEGLTATHGATGAIVGSTNTVTLTNKTLTTPVIATFYQDAGKTLLVTAPAATCTLVGKDTTDTLTNKTFDTAGTGNVFKINGTAVSTITGTGAAVLAVSPTITTPTLSVPVISDFTSANHDHSGASSGGAISAMSGYIAHSLATNANDFLVASGVGVFVKKSLAETKTILGLGSAAYTASTDYAVSAKGVTNGDSHDHSGGDGAAIVEAAITLADNTTNNVSTSKHGFVPKAPNDATKFLRGDATWDVMSLSDGTITTPKMQAYAAGDYRLCETSSASTTSTSYTKLLEWKLPRSGVLRISFNLRSSTSGITAYGRIYRNGSAVGTERSNSDTAAQTFSEDISGWTAGDLLQIYAKIALGGHTAYVSSAFLACAADQCDVLVEIA